MENYDPLKEYALEELKARGYEVSTPWDAVEIFEKKVASYAGSKFAVAIDNCTDAIFLCLKYLECDKKNIPIVIPKRTYVSIPMIIKNAGCEFCFEDRPWSGLYQLKPYPIYDSAVRFTEGMYIKDSFQCLSFHRRKILKLPKGGMILTNDPEATEWFKAARAKGRHPHKGVFYKDETFDQFGWNMFMSPERAAQGVLIFDQLPNINKDSGNHEAYHDLTIHSVFSKETNK